MTDFSKYIDLPFIPNGRSFNGIDCYGLVWLMYKEELGIVLPDFNEIIYDPETWCKDGRSHILENINEDWERIVNGSYKRFDIHILYDKDLIASHVGLNIGNGRFIHTMNQKQSVVSKLTFWEKILYGTVRWRKGIG